MTANEELRALAAGALVGSVATTVLGVGLFGLGIYVSSVMSAAERSGATLHPAYDLVRLFPFVMGGFALLAALNEWRTRRSLLRIRAKLRCEPEGNSRRRTR